MNNIYVINTPCGYVSGFSREHEIVQVVEEAKDAKHFHTLKSVEKFVHLYADAGYGLGSRNSQIERYEP